MTASKEGTLPVADKRVSSAGDDAADEPPAAAPRDTWTNDWEFIMSCIALSIGLGNVWRFPFVALENGGGAFLIPYLIVLFLVGQPVYYVELLMGQFSSRGSIKVYDMVPAMRGIGFGQSYSVGMCATYYSALIALTLRYLIASFDAVLPWSHCREEWGDNCIASAKESNTSTPNGNVSSSELYFYKEILNELSSIDDGIGIPDWRLVLCLGASWLCVVLILVKGIQSSGKASYFLALFPYVVMAVLLVRAVTLPGAANGILYLITPQWSELLNIKVWFAAVTQVFYSLGIFLGEIVTYASHSRFRQNVYKVAATITVVDTITSLTSGIIIFGILGNLAHETGNDDISAVVKGGTGLAFVSYPDAIAKFDWVPQVFSAFFFVMLFIIGVGCVAGLQVCLMTSVQDWFGRQNKLKLILCLASVQFLIGLIYVTPGGQYLVTLVDFFCVSFLIYVMAIAQLITFGWIYGVRRIFRDVEFMLNRKPMLYWRISWGIITPVLMVLIFVYALATWTPLQYNNQEYSVGISVVGWGLSAVGMVQIPIWMVYAIYKQNGSTLSEKFRGAFRSNDLWGPADPTLKKEYLLFVEDRDLQSKGVRERGFISRCWNKVFGK